MRSGIETSRSPAVRLRPWPFLLLLLGPLLVLVSLYLPWQEASCGGADSFVGPGGGATAGLDDLFACSLGNRVEGWSRVGDVAAMASVLLTVAAGGACIWPRLRSRLSLGQSALLLAYFTIAVAAETRRESRQTAAQLRLAGGGTGGAHFHLAYGSYVGLGGASIALLAAALISREALRVRLAPRQLLAIALATVLLASLLLPWEHVTLSSVGQVSALGIVDSSGIIAAVLAIRLLAVCWHGERRPSLEAVGLALGTALFVVAAITIGFGLARDYGAWIGLAAAVLLALVAVTSGAPIAALGPVTRGGVTAGIAGAVVVASLFLPWQTACYGNTADLSGLGVAGRCVSSNGLGLLGSVAAALTIALVGVMLVPTVRVIQPLEVAAGLALVVATLGFQLETGSEGGVRFGFGYGAYVGFGAVATLVALALARCRPRRPALNTALPSVLPVTLAIAYVAVVVLPWWDVLPHGLWATFVPAVAAVSWLTLASGLLGVRVVHLWARQARGLSSHARELVGLSFVLVALAILDAIPRSSAHVTWNLGVLLGLTVPLTALALIEERGGLRNVQIPALLRIDRI